MRKIGFDALVFIEAAPGTGIPKIAGALEDDLVTVNVDDIILLERHQLILGLFYAAESTPGYVEINQPSLNVPYQFLRSIDLNDQEPIGGFSNHLFRPLPIKPKELLNAYSNNATDEDTIIGLMIGDKPLVRSQVESVVITHKIRGVADKTITALTWTPLGMTWNYTLQSGKYAIVGMEAAGYIASGFMASMARIITKPPRGSAELWRPGIPITQAAGDKLVVDSLADHPYGRWGIEEGFVLEHDNMPDIEVCSPAALTDFAIELELVRLTED